MANPFLAVPLALHLIAASGGGVPTLDVRQVAAQVPQRKSRAQTGCKLVWRANRTLTINS